MPEAGTTAGAKRTVRTREELLEATSDSTVAVIAVANDLSELPGIRLAPGVHLRGAATLKPVLRFVPGIDGICVSSDNLVADLVLLASAERCAILNQDSVTTLGTLEIRRVDTTGRVSILARGNIRRGHVIVEGLDIISADSTGLTDKPHDYGVDVLQGAFTLWNMQNEREVVITADLLNVSAGRLCTPVLGSGIFVSGAGNSGGHLAIQHLQTGPVYSDGRIEPGTANVISGGVFVVYRASVDLVENLGPVTTYGPNDMALDNWGTVDRWISREKITTFGSSGVGFVNFGTIGKLRTEAPIETRGEGARGFNVYTGTVQVGDFDRIVTHGDGAVGVQISQPVGTLIFQRGIETFGTVGDSLVKGVVTKLAATALSIKAGGSAEAITVVGGLRTHGQDVLPMEQSGSIGALSIEGGFSSAPTT